MFKNDSLRLGLICGILAPVVSFWLYYLVKNRIFNPMPYLSQIQERGLSSAVLSLALLSNLGIFFLFIQLRRDNAARGVLFATILYAIIGFILKITS